MSLFVVTDVKTSNLRTIDRIKRSTALKTSAFCNITACSPKNKWLFIVTVMRTSKATKIQLLHCLGTLIIIIYDITVVALNIYVR
jgi:hypothetical protein